MRRFLTGMAALAGVAFAPALALADGADSASGVRLYRGALAGPSAAVTTKERGVRVHRGADAADALDAALEGGAAPIPEAGETAVKVVVVHHYRSRIRRLRTQGFYAGHPGASRRFTQGFYSGPVDKGRREIIVRLKD